MIAQETPVMAKVLIVDDDPSLRDVLSSSLTMEGYSVVTAEDGTQALTTLEQDSDIAMLISDVQMRPMSGNELLVNSKARYPELPVVLMTAFGTIESAVNAIHEGAADYLVKPFDHEALIEMVQRFTAVNKETDNKTDSGLISVDEKSVQLAQVAKRVAASEVTVMISGESGVGKEVVSRFIHENSSRRKGPFIAINCAAIPEAMLEAVLFGHEKGAYTGAYQTKQGKFEQAQGGTLLLDEITEMDLALQAKLLRVLQEREVERLGGSKVIELDVRIIATTNRDLRQLVNDGLFREDLFYRLNVFPLNILPLSQRKGDIMPLVNNMLKDYSADNETVSYSDAVQQVLMSHNWPGNIRELDNVIQRALILKTGNVISIDDIQFEDIAQLESASMNTVSPQPQMEEETPSALNNDLRAREQDLIISALNAKNSRKEVAEKLGISPRTLRYKLARMRDAGVALPA